MKYQRALLIGRASVSKGQRLAATGFIGAAATVLAYALGILSRWLGLLVCRAEF